MLCWQYIDEGLGYDTPSTVAWRNKSCALINDSVEITGRYVNISQENVDDYATSYKTSMRH